MFYNFLPRSSWSLIISSGQRLFKLNNLNNAGLISQKFSPDYSRYNIAHKKLKITKASNSSFGRKARAFLKSDA